jgi:CheY-like chemotaxis protein
VYRLHLIHWRTDEAEKRARKLEDAGYKVVVECDQGNAILRKLRKNVPDAVVIDLSRMPSYGRDVAVGIRMGKTTRNVPVVFVEGEPGKADKIKQLLPDAAYARWDSIIESLDEVIENPPQNPVVPKSLLAGYSVTPLAKKLGIKAKSLVALIGAPNGFEKTLGKVPEGVEVIRDLGCSSDLIIYFVKSRSDLVDNFDNLKGSLADKGGLWIAWPKKTSGMISDLTQAEVRSLGLSCGLVDYKICAIDSTWSGLKFAKRR